jgi:hypothetical protein
MLMKALLAMMVAIGLLGAVQVTPRTMDDPIPHCFPCDD